MSAGIAEITVAVLTPLPVEYDAVCAHILSPFPPREQTLPATTGILGNHNAICVLSGKGEANTAAAFQYACHTWKPRWVFLVGIAGGLLGLDRGDVIVASHVYYMDFGKLTNGKYIRRPEYDFSPDRSLLAHAELTAERTDYHWQNRIKVGRPDGTPTRDSRAWVGYVGSGNKVVDDPTHPFFTAVSRTIPELHAVEMEASGAGAALRLEQSQRAIGVLIVRGISDLPGGPSKGRAGSEQRQMWKAYASAAAASFVDATLSRIPSLPTASLGLPEDSATSLGSGSAEQFAQPSTELPSVGTSVNLTPADLGSSRLEKLHYVRVLLPLEAERVFIANIGSKHEMYSDSGGLSHVSEELLSLGCLQIAVHHGAPFAVEIQNLPEALRRRVTRVDEQMTEMRRTIDFFRPIAAELNVPAEDFRPAMTILPPMGASLVKEKDPVKKRRIGMLSGLFEGTYSLFLALRYKLQVDLDIGALTESADALRGQIRDGEGRANLASLCGLFRTYRQWTTATFQLARPGKESREDPFEYLWGNEIFRRLSHQQYLIGLPQETEKAVGRIGNLVPELIGMTRNAIHAIPRDRVLQASGGVTDASSQLEHDVQLGGFLPPIVPLRSIVWRAVERWKTDLPQGHAQMRLAFDGMNQYLPSLPEMIITEVDHPQRVVMMSTVPIENLSELDLFHTMLTDPLRPCEDHGSAARIQFQRESTGRLQITYRFCCRAQEKNALARWELKPRK